MKGVTASLAWLLCCASAGAMLLAFGGAGCEASEPLEEPDAGDCHLDTGGCDWPVVQMAERKHCCLEVRKGWDVGLLQCCARNDQRCFTLLAASLRGPEVCDGLDNDCNGAVDDVPTDALPDEPWHCTGCFDACGMDDRTSTRRCVDHECVEE